MSMKLVEALNLINAASASDRPVYRTLLACGFTPLHFETLLAAQLQTRLPDRRVAIEHGVFEDWAGTLERAAGIDYESVVLVLEWADLDSRLGMRSLGGWGPAQLAEIEPVVSSQLARALRSVGALSARIPVVIALPTLPFPPVAPVPSWQAGGFELRVRQQILEFAAHAAAIPNVRVLNPQGLGTNRHDLRAELDAGFPYTVAHAGALAERLSLLFAPPPPKKGLITDLDGTLWQGILGEGGVDEVHWTLEARAQIHGLYQQLLRALAESGVLIAVASKNDPVIVQEIFARGGLAIGSDHVFPFEVHWHEKSASVRRILETWNIGEDAVVFVDDSPLELAEVKAAFPAIETLVFPARDPAAAEALLHRLRDLFAKSDLKQEDLIRRDSLRHGHHFHEQASGGAEALDRFLRSVQARLELACNRDASDSRAFELVNKTNQFNLNGRRYTAAEWQRYLEPETAFLFTAAYSDKFGPLGKIAALLGRYEKPLLHIDTWVMSCRAFTRRIEYACLAELFSMFAADEIRFDAGVTPKNGPLRAFLAEILSGETVLTRERFLAVCPPLHQERTIVNRD